MPKQPLVSIIIPTFNRAHLIGETLDSVLAQTYQNWECIVVDDGSTDGTDAVMAEYVAKNSRFQYHHRPKDRLPGGNAARNYGFEISSGEFIIFLDSDDVLFINCVNNRIKEITDKDIGFLVCIDKQYLFNDMIDSVLYPKMDDSILLLFWNYKIPWNIMSVIWRREVIKEFCFDEKLQRFQDVDLHIRVLNSKLYNFMIINVKDNLYRFNAEDPTKEFKHHSAKILDSFIYLTKKMSPILINNIKYRNAYRRFSYTIYRGYVYTNPHIAFEKSKFFIDTLVNSKVLKITDIILFRIMELYSKFNLKQKKGLGQYILRNLVDNYYAKRL